jgi:hypothetical protein
MLADCATQYRRVDQSPQSHQAMMGMIKMDLPALEAAASEN